MENTSWLKQTKDTPLFPDMLWSRPENKRTRGKLLIIGGNSHSFAAVSLAYTAAEKAGIGTARILVPDALQKMLGKVFPEAEFAPKTISGSFGRNGLSQFMDTAAWADGVLLAGDFGRNSETAILLESFVKKYSGNLALSGDSLDYFFEDGRPIMDRSKTTLVGEVAQLQKILSGRALIKHSTDLAHMVELLAGFTGESPAAVVTHHAKNIITAAGGQASTTPAAEVNLIRLATYAIVWQLQQPSSLFGSLTTAALESLG